ncbi:hypothetical protein LEP1GSC084_0679 [Leptospira interrogans serovar Medanensis str. L0448]|uniref:Uncharacterized protein n=1 Tax=Leptospira interrogans str. 2006001854 TaxID=1001590 RepID=M6GS61_LEPIR|nr:hypothetical protein LEP1GSC099_1724 [Leptospira interrogans str. UI 08452]EMM81751.1 hypothetical protein LEP1GSC037_5880 [Leptospira interrogans str. 2006001854]EMN35847.1 hypothetical protein LEP1GSC084_0679 [Leptospira interrogans serovar Medanensis str. L0448]EMN39099.1 hypothetical protein LEP1GSC085_2821 [Leptospira interrogans str. L0996]EMN93092.1 hypothetical protein LEP1GSC110_0293 [Leptospira interrogans serovar Medanensis str. UT053]EMO94868.1 hypothetical protein LEP1GSC109_21
MGKFFNIHFRPHSTGAIFSCKKFTDKYFFKKIALILVLDNSICINLTYTNHFPVL